MSPNPTTRRVVITGLGVICPLGNTVDELWAGLTGRQSGVGHLEWVNGYGLETDLGAQARAFTGDIEDFGPLESGRKKAIRKALKLMCRETQMGVAASQRALTDAGLGEGGFDPERTGIVFGADYMMTETDDLVGSVVHCLDDSRHFIYDRWGGDGMRQITPLWLLKYLPNMPACHVAIYNDLRGPNNSLTQREASANLAVGEAMRTIQRGWADIMLAGACGSRIHPMKAIHATILEETATGGEPSAASRPFDAHRRGAVLGEGAAVVVLEELSAAQARGATIYAEVVGLGSSTVVDRSNTARRDSATANAVKAALADAHISPAEVGHVHAHGLSTRTADIDEAAGLAEALGPRASKVPLVAAKSNFGNLGAGAGLVELIASVLALRAGHLFPAPNYQTPDPACPVAPVTADDVPAGDSFVNVSFTPQGQASAIVVRRFA